MSENSDPELIEVMARALKPYLVVLPETVVRGGYDPSANVAKVALQALQSAGYVIEKPFWPPETQETRNVSAAGLSGGK